MLVDFLMASLQLSMVLLQLITVRRSMFKVTILSRENKLFCKTSCSCLVPIFLHIRLKVNLILLLERSESEDSFISERFYLSKAHSFATVLLHALANHSVLLVLQRNYLGESGDLSVNLEQSVDWVWRQHEKVVALGDVEITESIEFVGGTVLSNVDRNCHCGNGIISTVLSASVIWIFSSWWELLTRTSLWYYKSTRESNQLMYTCI